MNNSNTHLFIDMDDTVAMFSEAFAHALGIPLSELTAPLIDDNTHIFEKVGFFAKLEPKPDARRIIRNWQLSSDKVVFFVSKITPNSKQAAYEKIAWIEKLFPGTPLDNILFCGRSRTILANGVNNGILIDDNVGNCKLVHQSVIMESLFNKDVCRMNRQYSAKNWIEVERVVNGFVTGAFHPTGYIFDGPVIKDFAGLRV